MSRFEPANIKSTKEAIQRLINGEIFLHYYPDTHTYIKIFFKEDSIEPFSVNQETFTKLLNCYYKWVKLNNWYEDIPYTGVLCNVSKIENKNILRLILKYNGKFISDDGTEYDEAVPISSKNIHKYIMDQRVLINAESLQ